jgi:hypothetical protein
MWSEGYNAWYKAFLEVSVTLAHDRTRYQQGCRCSVCLEANRAYTSQYRQRRRMSGVRVVPALAAKPDPMNAVIGGDVLNGRVRVSADGPGPVVAAVLAEVDLLGVLASRPALCACAVAMAAILDNPGAITSQPSACRQLTSIMDELHRVAAPRRGRLAAVEAMSKPRGTAG